MYLELANEKLTPEMLKYRMRQWRNSTPKTEYDIPLSGALVARDNVDKHLKSTLGMTDAKSLFDAVQKEAKSKEWRVALAVSEIKESMAIVGAAVRWIPHNLMPSDPLTKNMAKGNVRALLRIMSTGRFQMGKETEEQQKRKEHKDDGGVIARLNGKAQRMCQTQA